MTMKQDGGYASPITPRRKSRVWMMAGDHHHGNGGGWGNSSNNSISPVDHRATRCVSDPQLFQQLKTYAKQSKVSTHFALQQILHEFFEEQQLEYHHHDRRPLTPSTPNTVIKTPPILPNFLTSALTSMTESSTDISKSLEPEVSSSSDGYYYSRASGRGGSFRNSKGGSFRSSSSKGLGQRGGSDRLLATTSGQDQSRRSPYDTSRPISDRSKALAFLASNSSSASALPTTSRVVA